jgi:hypothetical protein
MKKFLVTFSDTIVDEDIEVNGFFVMSDKEVLHFEELANSITWPFTHEFENGEELYYSNGEAFLSAISFKEITDDESKTVSRLFNDEFGFFIGVDFLMSKIDEEQDEGDDDFEEDDEDSDSDYYHDY